MQVIFYVAECENPEMYSVKGFRVISNNYTHTVYIFNHAVEPFKKTDIIMLNPSRCMHKITFTNFSNINPVIKSDRRVELYQCG